MQEIQWTHYDGGTSEIERFLATEAYYAEVDGFGLLAAVDAETGETYWRVTDGADFVIAEGDARDLAGGRQQAEAWVSGFQAVRYAADGHAGEEGGWIQLGGSLLVTAADGAVIVTGTLDECRGIIAQWIKGPLDDMRWSGLDGDVEAYHESDDEGCGGYAIRHA